MGLLPLLNRLVSFKRDGRRRRRHRRGQIRVRDGSDPSLANGEASNHHHDGSPQVGKKMRYSGPDIPEDILYLIHSSMPLRDAARAACVSHAFLRFWRCRPGIITTTLGLNENESRKHVIAREFNKKVDHILKKHSGIGLETLKIKFRAYNSDTLCYLNSWLEKAVTPEFQELTLLLPLTLFKGKMYNFPSALLSSGSGNSIRHLELVRCAFGTTVGLDCLKNLISLHLCDVHITEDQLGCLLSSSIALERLVLKDCYEILNLKIPCLFKRLSCLEVSWCDNLKVLESKTPNISSFCFVGSHIKKLLLRESLQLKYVNLSMDRPVSYACAKLPSIAPNLETLFINSFYELVDTLVVKRTFLHLKHLRICLTSRIFPLLMIVSSLWLLFLMPLHRWRFLTCL